MNENTRPRLVGINHIALEVGNIDEALAFYGRIFNFELRGRGQRSAFIDMGDQFIALSEGRTQGADDERHFGLVVDDRSRCVNWQKRRAQKFWKAAFWIFSTRGDRIQVSNTAICNSRRHRRY